jgi:hypothetical protein
MKWLLPFLLLWPCACLGQTYGEIPEQRDLKKALEIAVANNLQLKAARNEIEITDAERIDASKRLNPAFSAYFEDYRLFHSEMGPSFRLRNHGPTRSGDRNGGRKLRRKPQNSGARRKAQTDNVFVH